MNQTNDMRFQIIYVEKVSIAQDIMCEFSGDFLHAK